MDEPRSKPKRPGVDVKIEPEIHRGVYANKVIVAHSRDEFILDFIADLPPGPRIVARVVTTPGHAKAFVRTLSENVRRYESNFGEIEESSPRQAPPGSAEA